MKTFETTWDGKDGTQFLMQGWEPDHGKPKAVIALIHGLGEHTGRYAHAGNALTGSGYALIGFDLRGHGKSGGARGHFPSLGVVLQDIRQFFQQVTRLHPETPQFMYGPSLGALLALAYGLQFSGGLKGVIATGASLRSPLQEQKAKIAMVNLLGSIVPGLTLPSGLDPNTISRDPEVVKKYIADPLVHDRASLGLGKAALDAIELCFARARGFPIPLLIMHGAADQLTYPSGSEDFAKLARAGGADVTLKLWDGLHHEIHNEPEQAEIFRTMIDWLDGHV
ncbi:MAG TPA: lysophospholipase [Anaerolineales bacterium]|nr:lysophospholipase [Anaerolineales bacterium]